MQECGEGRKKERGRDKDARKIAACESSCSTALPATILISEASSGLYPARGVTPTSNLCSPVCFFFRDHSSNALLFGSVQSPLASPSHPVPLGAPPGRGGGGGKGHSVPLPPVDLGSYRHTHWAVPEDLAPSKLPHRSPRHSQIPGPSIPRLLSPSPPASARCQSRMALTSLRRDPEPNAPQNPEQHWRGPHLDLVGGSAASGFCGL